MWRNEGNSGQVNAFIDFIGKNPCVGRSYWGQLSEEWNVENIVRQGGMSSGILFNFYLNEVIFYVFVLPVGKSLNYSKFSVLGYADDLVLYTVKNNWGIYKTISKKLCTFFVKKVVMYFYGFFVWLKSFTYQK